MKGWMHANDDSLQTKLNEENFWWKMDDYLSQGKIKIPMSYIVHVDFLLTIFPSKHL